MQVKKLIYIFYYNKKKTNSVIVCCKKVRSFTSVIRIYWTGVYDKGSEIKIISLRFCYDLPADVSQVSLDIAAARSARSVFFGYTRNVFRQQT